MYFIELWEAQKKIMDRCSIQKTSMLCFAAIWDALGKKCKYCASAKEVAKSNVTMELIYSIIHLLRKTNSNQIIHLGTVEFTLYSISWTVFHSGWQMSWVLLDMAQQDKELFTCKALHGKKLHRSRLIIRKRFTFGLYLSY